MGRKRATRAQWTGLVTPQNGVASGKFAMRPVQSAWALVRVMKASS
jgi:hypothetical protein